MISNSNKPTIISTSNISNIVQSSYASYYRKISYQSPTKFMQQFFIIANSHLLGENLEKTTHMCTIATTSSGFATACSLNISTSSILKSITQKEKLIKTLFFASFFIESILNKYCSLPCCLYFDKNKRRFNSIHFFFFLYLIEEASIKSITSFL